MAPVAAPADYVSTKHPESVWITAHDRSVVRVHGPHMVADTVVGDARSQYVKIPLAGVERVTVSRTSIGKTAALTAVGLAVVVGGVAMILSHYGGNNSTNTCLTPNSFDDICGGPPAAGGDLRHLP
jgi:hypothetical protein